MITQLQSVINTLPSSMVANIAGSTAILPPLMTQVVQSQMPILNVTSQTLARANKLASEALAKGPSGLYLKSVTSAKQSQFSPKNESTKQFEGLSNKRQLSLSFEP